MALQGSWLGRRATMHGTDAPRGVANPDDIGQCPTCDADMPTETPDQRRHQTFHGGIHNRQHGFAPSTKAPQEFSAPIAQVTAAPLRADGQL